MKKVEIFLMVFTVIATLISLIASIIEQSYSLAISSFTTICWIGIAYLKQLTINMYERDSK
jgi:hypothetical protein